jgi:hypothetical protein
MGAVNYSGEGQGNGRNFMQPVRYAPVIFFASQMYSEYEKLENHTKYHNASDFIYFLGAY